MLIMKLQPVFETELDYSTCNLQGAAQVRPISQVLAHHAESSHVHRVP